MTGNTTLLTIEQVRERLLISEPTLRRYQKNIPDFPKKIIIGPRRVGYLEADVDAYIRRRAATPQATN